MIFATKLPNGTLRQCHAGCRNDLQEGSPVALNEHGQECHLACLSGITAEQRVVDDTHDLKMVVQWPTARKAPAVAAAAAVAAKDLLAAAADVFAGLEKDDHK